ncbi:MAG TPA: GNAT family N-acetyltransferase [Acidimicrobiales bacterium]|nr:GNAT family N-acetyltransferase [Acidimicrobiales bacterium]
MIAGPRAAARIEADQLELVARDWDAAVDRTPDADEFCASSIWSFAAAASFPDVGPPVVVGDGIAFAGMRPARGEDGTRLLLGLDPVWGFATPVVGHPMQGARLLAARLALEEHDVAVVAGQRDDGAGLQCLVHVFGDDRRLLRGPAEQRLRADLSGGMEPWLARRSSRFRQRLRQLRRRAEDAGITVVDCSALPPDEAIARVLAVEARSWKGEQGTGLASEPLAAFYRRMAWRLAAGDQLRLLFARRGDRDVGFVLGGVRGRTYRGLQLSFDRDLTELGLGHVLQIHQLEALEGTGIDTYDLGMDMPYKRRWADRADETFAVLIAR